METKQAESGLEGKVISIEKKSSAGEQKGEIRCEQRNGIPIKTWKRTGKATSGCRTHGCPKNGREAEKATHGQRQLGL
jgi:hypothetical protein